MTNYVLNEPLIFADIADNIAIVINSETGIYYGMNELGSYLFEHLIKGASVESIKSGLHNFTSAPADIEAQFDEFVKSLEDNQIIVKGPDTDISFALDNQFVQGEDFSMQVTTYADAQEMLLADPIHEVKEEIGWTPEKESIGYTKEETREREKKIEQ